MVTIPHCPMVIPLHLHNTKVTTDNIAEEGYISFCEAQNNFWKSSFPPLLSDYPKTFNSQWESRAFCLAVCW